MPVVPVTTPQPGTVGTPTTAVVTIPAITVAIMLPTLMAATLVARLGIVLVPVATLVPAAGPASITTPVPVMPILAIPVTATGIPVTVLSLEAMRTIACSALVVPVTPIRPVTTVLTAVGVSSVAAVPTGAMIVPAPTAAMTVVAT